MDTNVDEGEIIHLRDYAQKYGRIKLLCDIHNKSSKDQKGEMREHNSKVKERSKKCRRTLDSSNTHLLLDPVVRPRDVTVQPCKKLRKDNLLRQMEKLVEDFDEEDEVGKSITEPGTEQEVDELTHRRTPNVTFRIGSKS